MSRILNVRTQGRLSSEVQNEISLFFFRIRERERDKKMLANKKIKTRVCLKHSYWLGVF